MPVEETVYRPLFNIIVWLTMLGETHRRITKQIATVLKLGKRETDLLMVGSVRPDSWDRDFPHHKGKDSRIVQNLLEARRLYVQNDDECYAKLGEAFHYIQDRWTLRPRVEVEHTKYERDMQRSPLLNDSQLEQFIKDSTMPTKAIQGYLNLLEEIQLWIPSNRRGLTFEVKVDYQTGYIKGLGAEVLIFTLKPRPSSEWSNPTIDLNFAYRICLEIFHHVLSDREAGVWEPEIEPLSYPQTLSKPSSFDFDLKTSYSLKEIRKQETKELLKNLASLIFWIK